MTKNGTFGDQLTLMAMSIVYGMQWAVLSNNRVRHCLVSSAGVGLYDPQLPIGLLGHDVDSVH